MTGREPDWDEPDPWEDEEDDEEAERNLTRSDRGPVGAWGEGKPDLGENREDEIKRMARSHAELAMRTLADVARNGTKDAARVAAANSLLARGIGMPTRKSEQKVDVTVTDQRAAHFEALRQLAARNPVVQIEDAEFQEVGGPPRLENRRRYDEDEGD